MIGFEIGEITRSALHATLSGILYAFIILLLDIVIKEARKLPEALKGIFVYTGKLMSVKFDDSRAEEGKNFSGELLAFFKTLIFGVIFILLSYYSLDGIPRLYILALMIFAFILTKRLLLYYPERFLIRVIDSVYAILIIGLRIIFIPFKKIFGIIKKKLP